MLGCDYLVVLTAMRDSGAAPQPRPAEQAAIVGQLRALRGERLIIAAIRDPYDLRWLSDVGTSLCTYSSSRCSLEALADVLTGSLEPTGRLPVTVPNFP